MDFKVEPGDLDAYARQVGRAADGAEQALEYVKKECSISAKDMGPLSAIAGVVEKGHEDILANVESALKHLGKVLLASQKELTRSAKHYRQTDHEQAEKMDSTYPSSKR